MLSKSWVVENLIENVQRAMQIKKVTDRDGVPTGEHVYEGNVANRALELLGKEIGMFVDKREMKLQHIHELTNEQIEELLAEMGDVEVEGEPLMIEGTVNEIEGES